MTSIEKLDDELSLLRRFLGVEESILEVNPADQSADFFARAKRVQIQELQSSLRLAKSARAYELLEVRLVGEEVNYGSIPLALLARLAAPLSDALTSAAYRLVTGEELLKSAPPQLTTLLNLRLAGLGQGSTRLFISGNTAPDLTGESILETALRSVFNVLNSAPDSFLESVDAIGVRSTRRLSTFLQQISRSGLLLDLSWESPRRHTLRWTGGVDEAKTFGRLVSSVREPAIHSDRVSGEIRKLSDAGSIEIREQRGLRLRVMYSREQFHMIQTLHLGQRVSLLTKRYDYSNALTRSRTSTHHLDSIFSHYAT